METKETAPKPHGKDEVVHAIMSAAIPLIAERGVKAVSFRDIAEAANVNHGLITRHFGTKEALLARVGDLLAERMFRDVHDGTEVSLDQIRQIRTWLGLHRTEVRALVRILMDTTAADRELGLSAQFFQEVTTWFSARLMGADRHEVLLTIYMLATQLFGGEVLDAHFQAVYGGGDDDVMAIKEEAFLKLFQ
jgi:AcrR family transcriptional regulator